MMAREPLSFGKGVMWDDNPWQICFDETVQYGDVPCKHCHDRNMVKNYRDDGSFWEVDTWVCPRVIVVYNEGGCNSTGLCLDCVLEAVKGLEHA